jgi:hypothetical protein
LSFAENVMREFQQKKATIGRQIASIAGENQCQSALETQAL